MPRFLEGSPISIEPTTAPSFGAEFVVEPTQQSPTDLLTPNVDANGSLPSEQSRGTIQNLPSGEQQQAGKIVFTTSIPDTHIPGHRFSRKTGIMKGPPSMPHEDIPQA